MRRHPGPSPSRVQDDSNAGRPAQWRNRRSGRSCRPLPRVPQSWPGRSSIDKEAMKLLPYATAVCAVLAIVCAIGASNATAQTACADGTISPSTGSGTCSHHHGIAGGAPSDDPYYVPPASGGGGTWSYTGRYFSSPSGNVQCRYEPARQRLGCSSRAVGMTAWLSTRSYPWKSSGVISSRGPYLPYGGIWSMGGFRCESRTLGIVCSSPTLDDYIALSKAAVFTSED